MNTTPLKIMVVDDEAELRQTISTVLEVAGYEVVQIDGGEKALSMIGHAASYPQIADILITDLAMPAMSGIELVRELRSQYIEIPVLVITACGTRESAVEMLRLGVLDFIDKPFDAESFCGRVAIIAERVRRQRAIAATTNDQNIRKVLHDFNNWLSAIMGFADLISTMDSSEPPARQLDEFRRHAELITRAVQLSVQTLGKIKTASDAPSAIDMNATIRDTLDIIGKRIPCGISVVTSFEATCATITSDETDMRNLVLNCILNALQAMGETGRLTISTSNSGPDDSRRLTLRISDTGCGMTEEVAARVFEPGFSTKDGANRGLGLAHARQVVTGAGGAISVDSTPGRGTTFSLEFPLVCNVFSTSYPSYRGAL